MRTQTRIIATLATLALAFAALFAFAASAFAEETPYVRDHYGLFSSSEAESLEDKAAAASDELGIATYFVVVDDKAVLNKLAGEGRRGDMLRNAPLAIVVCGNLEKALEGDAKEYWVQDTSAATENLLLAAHALGLGAVWTGLYPITERAGKVNQILGMPEYIMPLCTVIIGYPDEQPAPKDKWKPENVSYNAYGAGK